MLTLDLSSNLVTFATAERAVHLLPYERLVLHLFIGNEVGGGTACALYRALHLPADRLQQAWLPTWRWTPPGLRPSGRSGPPGRSRLPRPLGSTLNWSWLGWEGTPRGRVWDWVNRGRGRAGRVPERDRAGDGNVLPALGTKRVAGLLREPLQTGGGGGRAGRAVDEVEPGILGLGRGAAIYS